MTRKSLFAAATAAAALAAFPAVASANPTPVVNAGAKTLTVNGDATDEIITISELNGLIALNGSTDLGGATVPADNTFDLTVNAGDGVDTVSINTVNLANVTVNGDAGNDTINGSPENDTLNGGAGNDTINGGGGNDRITGNQNTDTMNGDAGNDVMIWNNGDGNDVVNGGAGADEAELNAGAASENFSATPLAGGRVKFERLSPAPINLDVSPANDTEKLVLNAFSGNDTMVSDPAVTHAMLLNGGAGNDTLNGGSGPDLINGGDDNDTLNGNAGRDRLVGDRGADTMDGGTGDDALVWNNGDGSDVMDGKDGLDKIEVNGADAAEDFDIAPTGQRSLFRRTNIGPFSLDIGTSELLDLRALGGNDTFLAKPGNLLPVLADGGDGDDTLTGDSEDDTFFGGLGNDTLTGGFGNDLLDGQDGDDRIFAHDDAGDLVRGGAGNDFAQADAPRVDVVVDVETVDRPAPADDKGTPVDVRTRNADVIVKNGRAFTKIAVSCPRTEAGGCEGRLTLVTKKTYKVFKVKVHLVLGSARFDLSPGETKKLTVRLPKGIKKLAKNGKIEALAQTVSRDAAGNVATGSEKVTLSV